MDDIYLITDMPGYTPQVGRLLSMMNYARHTTLEAVKGLTQEQLDYLLDARSNSIGGLLMHFAAVEYAYQVSTFEDRRLSDEELAEWGAALELGDAGREKLKNFGLDYYLGKLETVRQRTCDLFRTVDDNWLYEQEEFWYGKQANRYFMWFHVFEDEINHRGQIRLIRNRLPGD
nr:DinB family protein [Paenibacillus rhizovicinus]